MRTMKRFEISKLKFEMRRPLSAAKVSPGRLIACAAAFLVLLIAASGVWAKQPSGRKAERVGLVCEPEGEVLICRKEDEAEEAEKKRPPSKGEVDTAYKKGFEDALSQMKQMASEYMKAQGYEWQRPMVQKVWLPPQIVNGLFIPGHHEYVLLNPAEWKLRKPEDREVTE